MPGHEGEMERRNCRKMKKWGDGMNRTWETGEGGLPRHGERGEMGVIEHEGK